jgi:hypothetical protein
VTGERAETDARSGRRDVAEGLDMPALERYFAAHVGGCRGRLHAELLHGGRSNLTHRRRVHVGCCGARRRPLSGRCLGQQRIRKESIMITTDWKKVFFAANRRLSQLLEKLGRPGMINAPAQPVPTPTTPPPPPRAVELWQAAWPDVLCTVPSGARRATEGRAS